MSERVPRVYIDACCFITLAQSKANSGGEIKESDQELQSAYVKYALRAARAGKMEVITSVLTIAEATKLEQGLPVPPDSVKRFYEMLFESGKSGVNLTSLTIDIATHARNLGWVSGINLKGADSIHVATALRMSCDELWTGENKRLGGKQNKSKFAELGLTILKPHESKLIPTEFLQMEFGDQK
jgi:hypothetical protein